MSTLSGGPNIVFDGLILYIDAANSKSYIPGSTIWNDISRVRMDGLLINGPTFSSANSGIIVFDGVNDYYEALITPDFNTIQTNNSLTISVFFRNNFNGEFRDIVGLNKVSGLEPFCIRQGATNDVLFYDTFVGGTRYSPTIKVFQPNNTWVHACATFGNNQINTYYNGVLIATTNTTGNIKSFDTNQFRIGNLGYNFFKGDISSVNLYNRALSATEVRQNFNSTRSRFGI
jgi:hypothetical protein